MSTTAKDCLNGISLLASLRGESRKREKPSRCCFVCSKIPGEILKGKRASYWCEDCGKALCVVPCFKIYHTQTDYKLHAKNFRHGGIWGGGWGKWWWLEIVHVHVTTHWRPTHYTCDVSNVCHCHWINFVHEKNVIVKVLFFVHFSDMIISCTELYMHIVGEVNWNQVVNSWKVMIYF